MPGRIETLTADRVEGWASHPWLPGYCPVVNVIHRSVVGLSIVAAPVPGNAAAPPRFRASLAGMRLRASDLPRLMFMLGETDEWIDNPTPEPGGADALVTVEAILAQAQQKRAWVSGATYVEAEQAGLKVESIIDMLYWDYLGRPADGNGLSHYAFAIRAGSLTYDDIRRAFVQSEEFQQRRKHVDTAPGTIFSKRIIYLAADTLHANEAAAADATLVIMADLLRLEGAAFVAEAYRQILRKDVDEGGLSHYLHELGSGVSKAQVLRHLAGNLEAITLGVRLIEPPALPEPSTPANETPPAEAASVCPVQSRSEDATDWPSDQATSR